MIVYFSALLLCLIFSAFLSGAEMAYVSANKVKIRNIADRGDVSAKKVDRLLNKSQHFLSALLISNNVVNVIAISLLAFIFHQYFGIQSEWAVTGVMAPLILIFGEMVPKDYCRIRAESFLLKYAGILSFILWVLRAPIGMILRTVGFFLKTVKSSGHDSIFVNEEEFRSLIDESAQKGVLDHHEKQIIDTILDFERVQLNSVMIPIAHFPKVSLTDSVRDVKRIAREAQAKMLLVYEELPSLIVGMIYVFDVLFVEDEDQPLKEFLRSPIFLAEQVSAETAFLTLQQKRQSYAVVTDAMRDVVGVVPIEKLLVAKF